MILTLYKFTASSKQRVRIWYLFYHLYWYNTDCRTGNIIIEHRNHDKHQSLAGYIMILTVYRTNYQDYILRTWYIYSYHAHYVLVKETGCITRLPQQDNITDNLSMYLNENDDFFTDVYHLPLEMLFSDIL